MFSFFKRSGPRPLTDAVSAAIARDGMPSTVASTSCKLVEMAGRYSDRKVTYFRVFDPAAVTQRSLTIKQYRDLDAYPGLIVQSGHIEGDGKVVVTRPVIVRAATTPGRTAADRSQHLDDAHIVVHGETGATANARPPEGQPAGESR
ncbi:MAG: hypothetical protein AB7K36_31260 [Chloroflexota bacterium]